MQTRLAIMLLAVLAVCLAVQGRDFSDRLALIEATNSEDVISTTYYDIDSDGLYEIIEIFLVSGRRSEDDIAWCGMGEKWEGYFDIRVRKGCVILSSQSLNKLMYPSSWDSLSFWTPRFVLVLKDYNYDGQIDFNLGQYANCNGSIYWLFTITQDGTFHRLPNGPYYVAARKNSTNCILTQNGLVSFEYYDQICGGNVTAWYRWDAKRSVFVNIRGRSQANT